MVPSSTAPHSYKQNTRLLVFRSEDGDSYLLCFLYRTEIFYEEKNIQKHFPNISYFNVVLGKEPVISNPL